MEQKRLLNIERIYLFLIISLIILTLFYPVPTDKGAIGISSSLQDIGDRYFYINSASQGFGYELFKGNNLYPLILQQVTKFTLIFNQDETSKLWNLLIISLSSILSIISLKFLILSTKLFFNKRISKIAGFIYILNPYTYFYALNGGLTFYIVFGVTSILYIFSKGCFNYVLEINKRTLQNIFCLSIICAFLSALRPSGAIFSLVILSYISIILIKKISRISDFSLISFSCIIFIFISITLTINSILFAERYIYHTIQIFQNEGGNFFGYDREFLRQKINSLKYTDLLSSIKFYIYTLIWKLSDFVAGFSDIRDTHDAFRENKALFPFLARIFTGIFYLMPFNILTIISLIKYFKSILRNNLWIIFMASSISISPSFLGVSMSRYWIMFYTPFILIVSKLINDIFCDKDKFLVEK